jgi:hypothetical protein
LIFDNVVDFADVLNHWPQRIGKNSILITSRDFTIGSTAILQRIRLDPLDFATTADIVLSILALPRTAENTSAAEDIAKKLGGLPLAVNQIAGFIHSSGVPLREFSTIYERNWKQIHTVNVDLPDYNETLTTMLQMALGDLSPSAQFLQQVMCFLDPDRISTDLFLVSEETKRTSDLNSEFEDEME